MLYNKIPYYCMIFENIYCNYSSINYCIRREMMDCKRFDALKALIMILSPWLESQKAALSHKYAFVVYPEQLGALITLSNFPDIG